MFSLIDETITDCSHAALNPEATIAPLPMSLLSFHPRAVNERMHASGTCPANHLFIRSITRLDFGRIRFDAPINSIKFCRRKSEHPRYLELRVFSAVRPGVIRQKNRIVPVESHRWTQAFKWAYISWDGATMSHIGHGGHSSCHLHQ